MNFIDDFLNRITMYRLVLYVLIFYLVVASLLSLLGLLPFSLPSLIFSTLFFVSLGWLVNTLAARFLHAPTNLESIYISALILSLIITPAGSLRDLSFFFLATVWTVASKFVLAINKKHLFNPAAFAVVLTAFTLNRPASWWIGNLSMFPFILGGGLFVVRKIRRFDLFFSFLGVAIVCSLLLGILAGSNPLLILQEELLYSPLFFFATIMLTEPLTSPPNHKLRIAYGALVGFLYAPQIHLGSFYTSPEIALVIGNLFSYTISPKDKLFLKFQGKFQISPDTWDFIFRPAKRLSYLAGQYMEWTLSHASPDSRGERRYFTLASSPTEDELRLGVKFSQPPSSYKQSLQKMSATSEIIASQLAGDFVLPKDPNEKLVFVAGGIGITPFRSMIKYLLDTKQKRSIILLYSNKQATDVIYTDVIDQAKNEIGLKAILTITDDRSVPSDWQGRVGRIDAPLISKEIPDYQDRTFYLSGPHSLVTGFEQVLQTMGISRKRIKQDYFPGFV